MNKKNKQIAELLSQVITLLNDDDEEAERVVTKKRGRPKKAQVKQKPVVTEIVDNEAQEEYVAPPSAPIVRDIDRHDFLAPVKGKVPGKKVQEEESEYDEIDAEKEKVYTRPEPVRLAGYNKFVDDLSEDQHLLQPKKEKVKYKPKTRRPKIKKIKVTCSVCHRPSLIYPSEIAGHTGGTDGNLFYRCNRCCGVAS